MSVGRPRRGERGMISIELCVGFVLAVALTAALAGASLLGVAQAAAAEASSQLARQSARGDEAAVQEAKRRAPEGAVVEIERQPNGVHAEVTVPVRLLYLGTVEVSARAWAVYEPGQQQ